jgi:SNF2 family DNA or RNA helicase
VKIPRPFPSDENSAPSVKRQKLDQQPGTSSSSFQPVNRPVLKYRSKNRRPTLVVCPTSLLSHWSNEIETHIDKDMRLKVHIHYATTKAKNGEVLNGCDVVLTTYGTLAAECDLGNKSALQQARWLRVILDEGHYIKNHR